MEILKAYTKFIANLHMMMLVACIVIDVCLLTYIKIKKIDVKDDYLDFHNKYGFIVVSFLKLLAIVFVFQEFESGTWMAGSLVLVMFYCLLVGKLLVKVVSQIRETKLREEEHYLENK